MRTSPARRKVQHTRTVKLFQFGHIEYSSASGTVSGSFELAAFPPPAGAQATIPFDRVVSPSRSGEPKRNS